MVRQLDVTLANKKKKSSSSIDPFFLGCNSAFSSFASVIELLDVIISLFVRLISRLTTLSLTESSFRFCSFTSSSFLAPRASRRHYFPIFYLFIQFRSWQCYLLPRLLFFLLDLNFNLTNSLNLKLRISSSFLRSPFLISELPFYCFCTFYLFIQFRGWQCDSLSSLAEGAKNRARIFKYLACFPRSVKTNRIKNVIIYRSQRSWFERTGFDKHQGVLGSNLSPSPFPKYFRDAPRLHKKKKKKEYAMYRFN